MTRYLAGAAYIQVLPSLRGFQKAVGRDLKAIDVRATAQITPVVDRAAANKAADDVEALAEKLAKARGKEADAAGKVRVVEEKLQQLRTSGKATAAQLAQAEERLASAVRASESAKTAATKATRALESAERRQTEAVNEFEKSAKRGTSALVRLWQQGEGVDRMSRSMRDARREALGLSLGAYRAASAVTAIGTAVPTVVGLVGALGTATGAGLALPGALVAGGAAVAALKVGVSGLGDAMKAAAEGDAEKLAEATAKLAAPARAVVGEYVALRPALDALRLDVQARLFDGVAGNVRVLANDYLPAARTGLADMAGSLNTVVGETAGFLRQQQTLTDFPLIFDRSTVAVGNLTGATQPLLSVLRDVVAVGSIVVADLTAGAGDAATAFATFIAQARASGQLEGWIRSGLQVLDQFGQVLGNVGSILGSVFGAAQAAGGGGLLGTVAAVSGSIAALLASAEGQNALITLFTTLQQVTTNLLPGVQAVTGAVLAAVVEIGPQLPALASGFSAAAIALSPLITDAARLAAEILPPLAALITWLAPALPVLAAGFAAGALALKAYVIVSAVVRWVQAWAAAQWALNAAMSANPIGIIIVAIAALVAGFIYLWNHSEAFRNFWIGLWEHIKTAALWVWDNALKPAFDGIVAAIKWVGEAASWLWNTILKPVFDAISLAARIVAAIFITVFVTPYVLAFKAIAAVATWLWETVLSPVFAAIGALFTWLWDNVISPVVGFVIAYIQVWAAVLTWLWQNVAVPVFEAIGAVISWLWANVVQPVFALIGAAVSTLGDAFSWAYNNVIKPVWDALGTAISWVWDTMISPVFEAIKSGVKLVGDAFSAAVDFIAVVWDKIKAVAAKPVNFIIETVYTNGIKAVWDKVAGFVNLDPLPEAKPITFAGGGVLDGYAPGRDVVPALLSPGEAVLVPELVREIGPRAIVAANAAASGRPAGGGGTFAGGGTVQRFAGGGVVGDLLGWIPGIGDDLAALWENPTSWVKARIGASGGLVDILAAIPETLISKATEWLSSKLGGLFGTGGTAVSGQLADWIRAAMAITGVGADWFGPLTTLIMRESGGNPAAINLWDINAQRGMPSQGLMQTIPSTFAAYRDPRLPNEITHPIANIVAGINYIRSRYGSIFNVQQANPGAPPMGYDNGGLLPPGYSTVYNGTGKPEAVFTDEQLRNLGGSPYEGVSLKGAVVEVLDDGLMRFVDGRIERADDATGSALLGRRRF